MFSLFLLSSFSNFQDNSNDPEKYFKLFLNKNGDNLAEVFLQHQPTLNDCKVMFKDDNYKKAFQDYNNIFIGLSEQMDIQNERFKNKTACRARPSNTNDLISYTGQGRIKTLSSKVRPDITYYAIDFLETPTDEWGATYFLFTFINGRWVYFPVN